MLFAESQSGEMVPRLGNFISLGFDCGYDKRENVSVEEHPPLLPPATQRFDCEGLPEADQLAEVRERMICYGLPTRIRYDTVTPQRCT